MEPDYIQKTENPSLWKEVGEIALYIILGYIIAVAANAGMGYALATDFPVVAVVSSSMEHHSSTTYEQWLLENNYTETEYSKWPFHRGLQKGDLVVVKGLTVGETEVGDVIVYQFNGREPIIHRVIDYGEDNTLLTKGDNNLKPDQENNRIAPPVGDSQLQGKAVFQIPLLGWVKIIFLKIIGFLGIA